jgi:hypothetical protein
MNFQTDGGLIDHKYYLRYNLIRIYGEFADSQRFRIKTLLIFHDPVSTRARRADEVGITPAKPGSGERSSPPGAERGSFSLFDFSRDCGKIRSEKF